MKKKGGSELDWVISLAIFLMYVVWFFIYLAPLTKPPEDQGSSIKRITDKLKANSSWNVEYVPIIIWSNMSSVDEPIIADFPFSWNQSSFAFSNNNSFLLDENKIMFTANITEGRSIATIAHSSENYNRPAIQQKSMTATSEMVSTANMRAEFKNSLLDKIEYGGSYLLRGLNLTVGNGEAALENKSVLITSDIIKYKVETKGANHSSYIFAGKPRIYSIIKTVPYNEMNISISATLGNMTSYYTDQESGNFNFNETCRDLNTNYIDAYTYAYGISFIFNSIANVSICIENHTIKINAHFQPANETRYDILLHTGDYNSTLRYKTPYNTRFGVIEKKTGISSKLMSQLNSSNYSSLKSAWSLKDEFSFTIVNNSNSPLFLYEKVTPPESANVFAKETETTMLDQYGNRQKARIRVRTW